jgi:hypothetical protein
MEPSETKPTFLLLDCDSHPIARGVLLDPAQSSNWRVRVLNDQVSAVTQYRELQLVSLSDHQNSSLVRIVDSYDDLIILEPLRPLSDEVRENLRVPVLFSSFIYPISGAWKGRRAIEAFNLSCGGISFSCKEPLQDGETLEVVVPVSSQPLILTCQVLRTLPSPEGATLYALKFIDLCDGEDKLVREFVFSEQIRRHLS